MSSADRSESVSRLARTYRWLLLAYPKPWRTVYGDEVEDVLVQLAVERDQGRPDLREATALVGNGLLMRVEAVFAVWTWRTRQRAAMLAAVAVGAVGMVALVVAEFIPWRAGVPLTGPVPEFAWAPDTLLGPMPLTAGLGALPAAAGLAGLLLVVVQRARAAQGVFAVTAAFTAVLPLVASVSGIHRPPLFRLGLMFGLLLLAAAAPTRLGSAQRRVITWLLAILAAALIAMAVHTQSLLGWVQQFYYDPPDGLFMLSALGVGSSVAALLILLAVPRLRGWAAPLALVSVWWWAQAAYLGGALPDTLRIVTPTGFLLACAAFIAVIGAVSRFTQTYTVTVQRTH